MKKCSHSIALLLGLCSFLFMLACRKDKDPAPVVSGQVLEYGTDKPLANAKVVLYQCDSELLGSINCSEVATAYTASEGGYVIPYPEGERKATLANAFLAGYFSDIDSEISVGTKPDYDANIRLYPHAWLRVKIKNESGRYGFGSSQLSQSIFVQQQGQEDIVSLLSKGNQEFKLVFFVMPSTLDTTGIKILDSNQKPLLISVGGALSTKVYLPGHDTTDITIIY
jgi:hypothetical protein